LGGILTGLLSARAETVLFLSCDMPFVSTRLLRQLITALEQSTSLRGVFARTGNTVGFPLVVRRDIVTDVEKLIAAKELSLQGLARRLKGKSIKVPTSRARELTNINTPEDLERVRHSSPRTA
jgi:molybdopterin-guanine dinucleotide biosynthesis protein A